MPTLVGLDYTYLVVIGYIVGFILIILFLKLRNRGKMRVFVKNPLGDDLFWRKPGLDEKGNFIIMQKADKKKFGWSFHFDNSHLQNGKGRLSGKFNYIEIFPNASVPIAFDYGAKKIEQYNFSKKDAEDAVDRKLLQRRGEEPKEGSGNTGLILLAILIIASIIVNVFLSGRITFH